MDIRRLTKKELTKFVDSDEFDSMPFIPVTRHRALSYLTNPRASDEDVLLLIAWEDNKMVGHLSILPDLLYDREAVHRVGWLSAIWVDTSVRRKGIAGKLLHEALDSWNYHILAVGWTPEAFGIYQKSGVFADLSCKEGIRAYLRFNLRDTLSLPLKGTFPGNLFLNAADKVLNIFNSLRLDFHKLGFKNDYTSYERSDTVDIEGAEFISRWNGTQMFQRSQEELDWILKYPWVLQISPENPTPEKRYHFASFCQRFLNEIIKIRDDRNRTAAFLMLTIRNKSLEIPYLYYDHNQLEAVARFIYRYMFGKQISVITIFNRRLSEFMLTNPTPFLSKHKIQNPYLITKFLADKLTDTGKAIQDGDGDLVFT